MMLGCLYLFVGGYVKIRVFNLLPYIAGLLAAGLDGFLINGLLPSADWNRPTPCFCRRAP